MAPYEIIGGKTINNIQIDPYTTDIWPKNLNVALVRGGGGVESVRYIKLQRR